MLGHSFGIFALFKMKESIYGSIRRGGYGWSDQKV